VRSEIRLYDRDPQYDIVLNTSDDVCVMGGAGTLNYLDLDGDHKPSLTGALKDFTILRMLPNIRPKKPTESQRQLSNIL
jgi:hypothetical protein